MFSIMRKARQTSDYETVKKSVIKACRENVESDRNHRGPMEGVDGQCGAVHKHLQEARCVNFLLQC